MLSTLSAVPSGRAFSPSDPGCPQQHGWRLLGTLCQAVYNVVAAALLSPCTLHAALKCCCQGFLRGDLLAVHALEQVVLCAKCLRAVCKVPGKVWAPVLVAWLYICVSVCVLSCQGCVSICVRLTLSVRRAAVLAPWGLQAHGQVHLPLLVLIALPACVPQDGPVPGTWPQGCVLSAEGSQSRCLQ